MYTASVCTERVYVHSECMYRVSTDLVSDVDISSSRHQFLGYLQVALLGSKEESCPASALRNRDISTCDMHT